MFVKAMLLRHGNPTLSSLRRRNCRRVYHRAEAVLAFFPHARFEKRRRPVENIVATSADNSTLLARSVETGSYKTAVARMKLAA